MTRLAPASEQPLAIAVTCSMAFQQIAPGVNERTEMARAEHFDMVFNICISKKSPPGKENGGACYGRRTVENGKAKNDNHDGIKTSMSWSPPPLA